MLKGKSYASVMFDQYDKRQMDDITNIKPNNLTFIFVKNKWRASVTFDKQYIISMHDVPKNGKVSVTLQSFLGRACGYNANVKCSIYCDLENATGGIDVIDECYSILPKK